MLLVPIPIPMYKLCLRYAIASHGRAPYQIFLAGVINCEDNHSPTSPHHGPVRLWNASQLRPTS